MHSLQESWARTAGHLREAERALGGAPHPGRAACRDWVEHNELRLLIA